MHVEDLSLGVQPARESLIPIIHPGLESSHHSSLQFQNKFPIFAFDIP